MTEWEGSGGGQVGEGCLVVGIKGRGGAAVEVVKGGVAVVGGVSNWENSFIFRRLFVRDYFWNIH